MGRHGSCMSEMSMRFFDSRSDMVIPAERSTRRVSSPGKTMDHITEGRVSSEGRACKSATVDAPGELGGEDGEE